jgi:hypothetical protein
VTAIRHKNRNIVKKLAIVYVNFVYFFGTKFSSIFAFVVTFLTRSPSFSVCCRDVKLTIMEVYSERFECLDSLEAHWASGVVEGSSDD